MVGELKPEWHPCHPCRSCCFTGGYPEVARVPLPTFCSWTAAAETGRPFDWKFIPQIGRPYFLAGGIGEENIDEALSLGPYCIDISSGAEACGVKNREKITYLVQKVRWSIYGIHTEAGRRPE